MGLMHDSPWKTAVNRTQSYTEDLLDFPVFEPSQWVGAVGVGAAMDKVAHLLLYGLRWKKGHSGTSGDEVITCPHRVTPERVAGLIAVSQKRPEMVHHLLREAIAHPDHDTIVSSILPEANLDPEDWYRVVEVLVQDPKDTHLEGWLAQRDWDQAAAKDIEEVMVTFVTARRVDLLRHHRAQWEHEPTTVDRLLDQAIPAPTPTDRPDVVALLLSAQPSERAVVKAWERLGEASQPDTPEWRRIAQMLPPEPLASVVLSQDFCWLSHEGNPIDTPMVADLLGRYARPELQEKLLAEFPGQLPAVQAAVRLRQGEQAPARGARTRLRS